MTFLLSSSCSTTTCVFLPSLCIVQPVVDFELRTIFIKKVSPSQAEHLRGLSRQMGRVRNFLPLLNKVSIPPEYLLLGLCP